MLAPGTPTIEWKQDLQQADSAFYWLTRTQPSLCFTVIIVIPRLILVVSQQLWGGKCYVRSHKPSLSSPDGCATDSDKLPEHLRLLQNFTVQEMKAEAKEDRERSEKKKQKHGEGTMWMCLEDNTHAVFPSHSALLHVLRLPSQFLKKWADSQLSSSKTSCFSPAKLLLLPIVQVLLRDSCDENLINFNKLSWRKTNRSIRNACSGVRSTSVGS